MSKNKKLLIINILLSIYLVVFSIGTIWGGVSSNAYVMIPLFGFLILTVLGSWLLYLNEKSKLGIEIIKFNYIVKYIVTVVLLIAFTILLFALQECIAGIASAISKGDPVTISFADRMKILVVMVPIWIFATLYFSWVLSFIKRWYKNKLTNRSIIKYIIANAVLALVFVVEIILTITKQSSLVRGYIGLLNISNSENSMSLTPFIVLFIIGEVIYLGLTCLKVYWTICHFKEVNKVETVKED